MRKIGKKHHKNLAALIILLALSGAVIAGNQTGILNFVEYKLYDPRINFFAHRTLKSQDIILVLLDQESIENAQRERGWGWPWPRKAYADLLDYLNLGGAKSVSFDMLYSEPSIYRSINDNEDDASFARAAESYGRVVQGVLFSTQTGDVYSWPPDLDKPFFKTENFDSFISSFDLTNDYRGEETKVRGQFPIKELRDTAAIVGSVTGRSDTDHIYRRLRLFTIFDGKPVPSLGAAALLASGYDNTISYDSVKKLIRWGEYTVPVDDEGKTLLRFRGDPITRYPRYPMYDVLKSAEDYAAGIKPEYSPEDFNGTYVFVGVYGPGLYDIFPSPISSTYPGMGAHVTMLDNLLMGDFITKAPDWLAMVIIAGSVLLMVILVLYSGVIVVTIAGMVISIAALIIAGFLAFRAGWWIPMAAPIIAVSLSYLTATLYSYATEGKDKRFIKNAFSRILSPKVIDQIIADPSQLKLGGERRKMTAIFTDVQRFSTISSVLQDEYGEDGPKVLVNLLNLYLTEMSNIILENGGTIDKYEGDAIIAFFGAPAWMEDHAALACLSALQIKNREVELKQKIMNPDGEFFKPLSKLIDKKVVPTDRPLFTRLGINTGDMVVGFMGTPAKMDYTIMGNAVNLAARLEGVNKQYDTRGILISEYTRSQIGNEFIIRPLSRVTVVGIPVPLRLYELLDVASEASHETLEMIKLWETAFKAYENRDFDKAQKEFAEIFQKDPEDKVAKLYLERCEKFTVSPPSSEWDGVDNLTEK